jgi:hypothetical protein
MDLFLSILESYRQTSQPVGWGVHGHISFGWLQADIDSVNRLSWIAMTDVTEGSDTVRAVIIP